MFSCASCFHPLIVPLQENSAGFKITNAFGGVLDEKLVAENYLRASGLDYTIVS